MDTVIFLLILGAFLVVVRGAERRRVMTAWVVSLVAMLLLFEYHVTSRLDLNF